MDAAFYVPSLIACHVLNKQECGTSTEVPYWWGQQHSGIVGWVYGGRPCLICLGQAYSSSLFI